MAKLLCCANPAARVPWLPNAVMARAGVFTDTVVRQSAASVSCFHLASSFVGRCEWGMRLLHHISGSYCLCHTQDLYVALVCAWLALNLSPSAHEVEVRRPFSWGVGALTQLCSHLSSLSPAVTITRGWDWSGQPIAVAGKEAESESPL